MALPLICPISILPTSVTDSNYLFWLLFFLSISIYPIPGFRLGMELYIISRYWLAFFIVPLMINAVTVLANPTLLHNRETSSLSSKLLETLNGLSDTQPTLDVSQITQQINQQKAQIDNLNATTNKRDVRSGLACTVSRLVLGADKYIDASSPSYTNETRENWQVIPTPKAHPIYATSNWHMWIGLRTAGFPPHVSWRLAIPSMSPLP